ncbi:MAG: hypothetical protein GQ535_01955 [Rhodobacteraceae bacterium]|nr:hypothetical protein [Paracoccaceae bacterium]
MARIFALLLILLPGLAQAVERALIVGNDDYDTLPSLLKAQEDADGYTELLTRRGFEVTTVYNAPMAQMRRQLAGFYETIEPGDTVAFIYSGHGWSDGSLNYLVPTDAEITASAAVAVEMSIPLKNGVNGILDNIAARQAHLTIAVVDACRNNPFGGNLSRAVGVTRGLAPVEPAQGTFLIYSAGAGQAALDRLGDADTQEFSVFTRFFLRNLDETGDLRQATIQTRNQVQQAANIIGADQRPAYYDELSGTSCLFGDCDSARDDGQIKGVIEEWAFVQNSKSRVVLNAFINKWGGEPLYVALAQEILESLPVIQASNDTQTAFVVPERTTAPVPDTSAQETRALNFTRLNIRYWSQNAPNIQAGVSAFYADQITFYGKDWTQEQVMTDKAGFIERWPVRAYDIDEDSTRVSCQGDICSIEAKIVFFAYAQSRAATSRGLAQFSYVIDLSGEPKITSETSSVLERY